MMKKLFSIFLLGAMASLPAFAQTSAKLTATKANEFGLIYTLPLTAFEVTIAVEKTVSTPGEHYQYARKYLNADPIMKPAVAWRITDAVINPIAIADEDQRYLANFKGGNGTFMMLTDSNFPLSVNDEDYDPDSQLMELPKAVAAEPTVLQKPIAQQAITPEMIQSKSSAKRAELAAEKIYELRTNRNEIISGQADAMPSDGAAMKLALDQLSAQEEALTAMFLGTVQKSVEVRTYTVYVPDEGEAARTVVARLSALDGLVAPDDLSGDPIYAEITPVSRGELPVNEKGVAKTFPKGGVAYRIPGSARVSLSYEGRTLAEKEFDVAQYGVVFGLDPALFTNKREPAYLHFNPLTGAVRELGTVGN
ncbi:MAG: DUF4831 family protein [Duncaniella sp.]|uniref:DUF4831 family protein n=1 Tax=Duncaniella sp. TaxID=2518496 RepID=UPI0023C0938D|nr:DUF4831 family protein [Duncaniella sp.]MDE6090535.1 DUF4831 family protein [Duncaniella sp.]